MLTDHICNIVSRNLGYEPTTDQSNSIKEFSKFILPNSEYQLLIIDGHAGTGKTTLIKAFAHTMEEMKIPYELMAPTGRAAKVISGYCNRPSFTIHKRIYRQKDNSGLGSFVLNFNNKKNAVFIVDESSMISNQSFENSTFGSGRLLEDLIQFVYSKPECKLILIGDTAQLPPVGIVQSPALDLQEIKSFGINATKTTLKQVVRQEADMGILINATSIRKKIESENNQDLLISTKLKDVERLSGIDFLEKINDSYDKHGMDETMVVCRSNKQANKYNQGIRNRILYREEEISQGDYLMVVKNSYSWLPDDAPTNFIANGDIIKICRIHKFEEMHGFRFCEATIELIDYSNLELRVKIMLDALASEGPSISKEQSNNLYNSVLEDYAGETSYAKKSEKIKADPYYNALQVKFAYAITCHKAQGGQWKNIFLDAGYIPQEQMDIEYLRWLYTAFTRATEKLYLVNFPEKYFLENEI
ncbi:MAG: AAA family ATPase [Bacteroidia bacterium]|nr:AAA family ATPase [Bacteroidia bacterium]